MSTIRFVASVLGVSLAAASPTIAGDLTPPSAPSATMKALDVVEPRIPIGPLTTPGDADSIYRITQPGSYYLTGDVVGVSGRRGIEIASSNVTVDLTGFTLQGVAGSLEGIGATGVGDRNAVRIRNGAVQDWGGSGIDLDIVRGSAVARITALRNDHGVVLGAHGTALDCHAEGNLRDGIRCSRGGGQVKRSAAVENGRNGIDFPSRGVVEFCRASGNGAVGVNLFNGGRVVDTSANGNASHGINLGDGTAIGCQAQQNGQNGISAGLAGVVDSCAANFNSGDGVSGGGVIVNTAASFNRGAGVRALLGAQVSGCTMQLNWGPGIAVNDQAAIVGNTVQANGNGSNFAPGIHVLGNDNRIDGNHVVGNDVGLDVDGMGNIIMRNTAAENGVNYQIVANNFYGRIVDQTLAATPAVNGNSATNQIGTAEPWSNFAH